MRRRMLARIIAGLLFAIPFTPSSAESACLAFPPDCNTDADAFDNPCDGDFNQDGFVNAVDFVNFFLPDFLIGADGGTGTDMDCNAVVNANDFDVLFLPQFVLGEPGP